MRLFKVILWYVFFSLFLLEVFARIAYAIPATAKRLTTFDEGFWRRGWIEKHKKSKDFIYSFDLYDPVTGWRTQPDIRDKKLWEDKRLNTNDRGLRGTRNYNYEKPEDTTRILVLGDSFTFGEEVSDNETWPFYMQQLLPHTEVINMGVHGFGHDQMLLQLKEEGVKYQPDIVILGYLIEDMHRNMLAFRDFAKPKYVVKNNQLKLTNSPVPTPEEVLKWDWLRPRILDLWSFIHYRTTKANGAYDKQEKLVTAHLLKEIVKTVKETGAIPVIAYLPYGTESVNMEPIIPGETFLFETCEKFELPNCFSVRPLFQERTKAGAKFRTEYHWRPLGHKTVAEAVKNYLVEHGIVEEAVVD